MLAWKLTHVSAMYREPSGVVGMLQCKEPYMENLASLKAFISWRQQSCKSSIPAQTFLRLPSQYRVCQTLWQWSSLCISPSVHWVCSAEGISGWSTAITVIWEGVMRSTADLNNFMKWAIIANEWAFSKNDRQEWNDGRLITTWQRNLWGNVSCPRCRGLSNCREQLQLGLPFWNK